MASAFNPYILQRAQSIASGITLVRKILAENSFPNGFTTKQLYELSQKYPAPPSFQPYKAPMPYLAKGASPVPRPDHPIRSIKFLKTQVLPALEGVQEIKSVNQPKSGLVPEPDLSNLRPVRREARKASANEFVWKLVPPEEVRRPKTKASTTDRVVGREVGVGADTSHLNKRRQRARVRKVSEAVLQLKAHMRLPKPLAEVAEVAI
ncbi:hypothetical protein CPB83DRAFT_863156 [Crepidotus variabilis]|uniref:Uncharacterized protein n=1 Tax=Crepidotus variabilis TaxID=179855 RepID=A0A9P6JJI0_9AGAR|nr:hypothetical protein CPB83DRAFT_863156 [Crepidotus variabilis]